MKNKVAIIIVNWNGKKFLKNCLNAVYDQTYKNFQVYFVDNGSVDGSSNYVKKNFPKTKIIQLKTNTGFARGNNEGIKEALKDKNIEYIVCLNNDTRVDKDFLLSLVETADSDPRIGSVAPKIRFFYEKNLIDSVGILIYPDGDGVNRGFKEKDEGQYDKPQEEIFGTCGAATLYKRKMLEDIKYRGEFFDNIFFAYYEDLDLAWRARLRGWRSVGCPKAVVYHIHSATGVSYSPFKAYHVDRNRFFVIIKSFPGKFLVKAMFLTPLRYMRLVNSILTKKGPSYKLKEKTSIFTPFIIVLKGWLSIIYFLPAMFKKRKFIQSRRKVSNREIESWFRDYSTKVKDMI